MSYQSNPDRHPEPTPERASRRRHPGGKLSKSFPLSTYLRYPQWTDTPSHLDHWDGGDARRYVRWLFTKANPDGLVA